MAAITTFCYLGFPTGKVISGLGKIQESLLSQENLLGRRGAGLGPLVRPIRAETRQSTSKLYAQPYKQVRPVWRSVVSADNKLDSTTASARGQSHAELIRSQPMEEVVALVRSYSKTGISVSDREAWMYGQTLKDAQESAVMSGQQLHDVKRTTAALVQMGLDQERATVLAVVYADVLMDRLSDPDHPPHNNAKETTKAAKLLAGAMLALLCILALAISKVPWSSTALPTAPLLTALFSFPTISDSMLIEASLSSSS